MPDDSRAMFNRAARQAERVVATVEPGQLGAPTPCTEMDVRALLRHMVSGMLRVDAMGRQTAPEPATDVADDGWAETYRAAREAAERTWSDDALLSTSMETPFGTMTGGRLLGVFVVEVVTHTWDLWHAIGSSLTLDPEIAAVALASSRAAVPEDRRGAPVPFGPVVPVSPDADVYSQLAGWLGRQP
jgi:uncharacterized protein (TIGR03086 family)